jgi:hypothetical protein
MNGNARGLRYVCVFLGVALLVFAAGYVFQVPWATSTWPWPDSRLSYIFVGSIQAAIAAAVIWIALSGEWAALAAGALNMMFMAGGMAIFLFELAARDEGGLLWVYAAWCAVFALLNLGILFWSRRYAIRDPRPTPPLVRISFVGFAAILLVVGVMLLMRAPNVFPWPLDSRSSVMFGWIYIGAACYFLYAVVHPRWHNARAQLWGFLAYDAVLIPPFLAHFADVEPGHVLSLVIYMTVLIYSAALAIYYLFVNRATRSRTAGKEVI